MKNKIPCSMQQLNLVKLKRVLLSVSNKDNLFELCSYLTEKGCELVATSSTLQSVRKMGFACSSVSDVTHFPEILGGRVKTLHPSIFGGILARQDNQSDCLELQQHNIQMFDLVVCNLYPVQQVLENNASNEEIIESIDIGGVSLLRAAAKNYESVSVLCDTADYKIFIELSKQHNGSVPLLLRKQLAVKVFSETSAYDYAIFSYLEKQLVSQDNVLKNYDGPIQLKNAQNLKNLPESFNLSFTKHKDLRYGENPHQNAALYKINQCKNQNSLTMTNMNCFHGKELSYNNVLDIEHAIKLSVDLSNKFTAVILKHNTPCGVGVSSESLHEAYKRAFEFDPVSPFGGIVCFNSSVTYECAVELAEIFLEVIIAPHFDDVSLEVLRKKKNLRLVTFNPQQALTNSMQITHVQGAILLQSSNNLVFDSRKLHFATKIKPNNFALQAFQLGMSVVKHVRSNAIVVANRFQTLAIAGGFTNRVDAVAYCLSKVNQVSDEVILASDAFFPFSDSIELIKNSGIRFVIQPGGSIQDANVIKACDDYEISMAFTNIRHFKH
jgi:phosphoribosylaminoimidazolecarboxamide formyltransferase/IMP cyclohydrolase